MGVVHNHNQSGILKSGNKNVQFKNQQQKQGTGYSNPNSRSSSAERTPHQGGKNR